MEQCKNTAFPFLMCRILSYFRFAQLVVFIWVKFANILFNHRCQRSKKIVSINEKYWRILSWVLVSIARWSHRHWPQNPHYSGILLLLLTISIGLLSSKYLYLQMMMIDWSVHLHLFDHFVMLCECERCVFTCACVCVCQRLTEIYYDRCLSSIYM